MHKCCDFSVIRLLCSPRMHQGLLGDGTRQELSVLVNFRGDRQSWQGERKRMRSTPSQTWRHPIALKPAMVQRLQWSWCTMDRALWTSIWRAKLAITAPGVWTQHQGWGASLVVAVQQLIEIPASFRTEHPDLSPVPPAWVTDAIFGLSLGTFPLRSTCQ